MYAVELGHAGLELVVKRRAERQAPRIERIQRVELPPHLVMRGNLDRFLQTIAVADGTELGGETHGPEVSVWARTEA